MYIYQSTRLAPQCCAFQLVRAGGTGPADQATAGPKLQKPTTQNFSLLFIYTLIVLYQQQYNLLFV